MGFLVSRKLFQKHPEKEMPLSAPRGAAEQGNNWVQEDGKARLSALMQSGDSVLRGCGQSRGQEGCLEPFCWPSESFAASWSPGASIVAPQVLPLSSSLQQKAERRWENPRMNTGHLGSSLTAPEALSSLSTHYTCPQLAVRRHSRSKLETFAEKDETRLVTCWAYRGKLGPGSSFRPALCAGRCPWAERRCEAARGVICGEEQC